MTSQTLLLLKDLMLGPVLALGVAAVVVLLGRLLTPRAMEKDVGAWWGTVAMAAAYLVGQRYTAGWPLFPPTDAIQRLFFLVLATGAVGMALVLLNWQGWRRFLLVSCLMVGTVLYLLLPLPASALGEQRTAWLTGLGVGSVIFWTILDDGAARGQGMACSLSVLIVLAGTMVLAHGCHTALLGQLSMVLMLAFGPIVAAAWRWPSLPALRGAMLVVAVVLPYLWLYGLFSEVLPARSVCLLAAAPAVVSVLSRDLAQRLLPGALGLLRPLSPVLLVGVAVIVGVPWSESDDEAAAYRVWSAPVPGNVSPLANAPKVLSTPSASSSSDNLIPPPLD